MTTKFYVDADGAYIGGFAGAQPPQGAIEVPTAPDDARQKWDRETQAWGGLHDSPYRLYKSTLIRRLTEQEASTLKALLDSSPDKMQMLWDASEWLGSDDPLFDTLKQAISGALGEDRAEEILDREE